MQLYAPLPAASLGYLCGLLRYGVPHLAAEVRQIQSTPRSRYAHAQVDGLLWFWPKDEKPGAARHRVDDKLRSLRRSTPWSGTGGASSCSGVGNTSSEAYVPAHKRRMGHYAMPMLWGDQVLGWANLKVVEGRLQHELGFVGPRPRDRDFHRAVDEALQHMHEFLDL